MAVQQYAINENLLLRRILDQIYVVSPRESLVQRPVVTVTADGVEIHPHHINVEVIEGEYAIKGEIQLYDQAEFLACRHLETEIVVTIDADEYHLLVESPRRSRPEVGRTDYYVPLVSATVLLDAPYAATISQEFAGAMASAIVAELAATSGISVQWSMVDWYIPAGTLYANNETPMAVIAKIVAAAGGIKQTSPAGVLICRPEYPVAVTAWETAAPALYLTDMDNFFSVDSAPEIRDGYNKFLISSQDAAQGGLTLESVEISASAKKIEVYQVPFVESDLIALKTSGGSWVTIADDGIKDEELTDLVEIVAGEGKTRKPIYSMTGHTYKQAVLGAITIAEDGRVTTEISGNTLIEIIYTTKYRQFTARSPQIEDVQFYPEVTA
jgi:hypothetical protein